MSIALEYGEPDPELLRGTVDLHIHSAPDIFPRHVSAITAAEAAKKFGMAAIVVKSHSTDTAARAETARELVDFPVYGGVVLNYPVGGLNEYAVLETARQGGRIVWLPTINARHFIENSAGSPMLAAAIPPGVPGLVVEEDGELTPETLRVLDAVAEHGLTLATGHLYPAESLLVGREAIRRGIRRVIVTHPHVPFVGMPVTTARELGEAGAYIEITDHEPVPDRVTMIRTVGVERCYLSTDGGTLSAPPPVVRLSSFIAAMLEAGFTEAEVRHMSSGVPAYLLGLAGDTPPVLALSTGWSR
jgi:hypothetical protein